MANCWICGRNGKNVELASVEALGGVSFGNKEVPFDAFICWGGDENECDSEAEAKAMDYPEDTEATPCLDEPWWRYR